MYIKINSNKKTYFTRKCISEAILILLKNTEFNKLKVSSISKKAGISRMTFYKYYDSPKSALTDYLRIIISEYMEESTSEHVRATYMSYEHILYSLNFFDRYSDYFLTLAKYDLHSIILEGINGFMLDHIQTDERLSIYELYSYAGGLMNTFIKWEENGKTDSAEEVARRIYKLYGER